MSDSLSGELQDWTEVNILPFSPAQPGAQLIGVVDRVASEIRCKSMGPVPASWSGYAMVLTFRVDRLAERGCVSAQWR